ncbi:MAG: NifB/NifX family molybdenum-iron cluster-binding protein [Actinomycetota bacterium]|nr:NifB/NifX family molybdenum-iron cluster-binding protein [Actinomycetota bacterium]
MSEKIVVAVPSAGEGGLNAPRSAHFGHSEHFTIVDVVDGQVGAVDILPNPPHEHGGCMSTVNLLHQRGVTAVAAVGMGGGPLSGLQRAGIAVYFEDSEPTVAGAIAAVIEGRTQPFTGQHVCRGH